MFLIYLRLPFSQALAPDLLDLDLGEAQSSTIPESQDLVVSKQTYPLHLVMRLSQ